MQKSTIYIHDPYSTSLLRLLSDSLHSTFYVYMKWKGFGVDVVLSDPSRVRRDTGDLSSKELGLR